MIDATIEAASVDTRVEMRDNDLRGPHFFDASKYPTLTFKSKKVAEGGPGKLKVTGDLTIHGVTKEVTLDVEGPSAPVKDPRGNLRVGASASTTINRKDFGVDGAAAVVGDDVPITIDMELPGPGADPSGQRLRSAGLVKRISVRSYHRLRNGRLRASIPRIVVNRFAWLRTFAEAGK